MPLIQTDSQHYSDIADAIRDMSGNEETFYPSEMAAGVRSIPQTIAIQPIIYSLEEREVGVWTDGKPLYQKTVNFGAVPANTMKKLIDCGITIVDKIAGFSVVVYSGNTFIELPLSLLQSQSLYLEYGINVQEFDKSTGEVRIDTGTHRSLDGGYVTLLYTKTTDTPGSGTWTPSGVPAHHYSTNEQVIGTWIDGKPLYEKTIEITKTTTSRTTWQLNTYNISLGNIKLYNIYGTMGASTSSYRRNLYFYDPSLGVGSIFAISPTSIEWRTLWTDIDLILIAHITLQYTKTTD